MPRQRYADGAFFYRSKLSLTAVLAVVAAEVVVLPEPSVPEAVSVPLFPVSLLACMR